MELFMLNEGLIHISETIFDYLEDDELIKCLQVCKSWHNFVNQYGRKRLIKKLDVIVAFHRYDTSYHQSDFRKYGWAKRTLFEVHPDWSPICEYMKVNESMPALKFFVERMDKLHAHVCLSCLRQNLDPLTMYMHLGDIKFVKLCLKCPLVDFTNALVDVIGSPDIGFDFDFRPYAGYKVVNILLENAKKVNINVNAKGPSGRTALHFLVLDNSWQETTPYLKLMLENTEKYGIDIKAIDRFGDTPFEGMLKWFYNYDRRLIVKQLDCWLKFPHLFKIKTFKKLGKEKLKCIMTLLYEQKVFNGESTDEMDEKLGLAKKRRKIIPLSKFALDKAHVSKEVLGQVIWQVYQDKIKAYKKANKTPKGKEPSAKKRKL